ncbi:hypothetical protein [Ancylobacter oerskovii]|uniref:Uncharacterized protein n=1 Tax=Ancylobacter oerskovii TaxID=459519 RepID=A0ABW4YWX7_9HYPH
MSPTGRAPAARSTPARPRGSLPAALGREAAQNLVESSRRFVRARIDGAEAFASLHRPGRLTSPSPDFSVHPPGGVALPPPRDAMKAP